jgi:hypothetical protein
MKIPTSFRIKRKKYTVKGGQPRSYLRGQTHHDKRIIHVYEDDRLGIPFSEHERGETFIHELTHAVLYDMKHPLWSDERFVTRFAELFYEAIRTSKL